MKIYISIFFLCLCSVLSASEPCHGEEGSFLVGFDQENQAICTRSFPGLTTKSGEVISPLREAAIHRYLARTSVYNLTIALNHEFMKRGSAYPVFYHWIDEKTLDDGCEFGESVDGYCIPSNDISAIAKDHYFAGLYAYQLNDLLSKISATPYEKPCLGDLAWKNGDVFKEKSEGRSGGVVVLQAKYCDGNGGSLITNFRIEDALGAIVTGDTFRYCNGPRNGGRYHHDFHDRGSLLGMGPLFVRYEFEGKEECRRVDNPSQSYR